MSIGGTAGIQLLNIDGSPVTQDQLDRINEAAISHQNFRKKLWCDVALSGVENAGSAPLDAILDCSDKVLAAFDKRFGT